MRGTLSTLATVWRISVPYFNSEDRWPGRILLAAVVAIELSIVGITVLFNEWNARFYNALQDRDWNTFIYQLGYFCILAAAFILLAVYQLYLNQWLQIRWRRWLTQVYLGDWLADSTHYRMQLQGDAADNPDQRIADDLAQFILLAVYQLYLNQWLQIRWRRWLTQVYLGDWLADSTHYRMQLQGDAADNPDQRIADDLSQFIQLTLTIGLQVLNSTVTLASFAVILWGLSKAAPLHLFGTTFDIPGYLFWAALIYAVFGTVLTNWIGRPLVSLNFQQQRYEADFRFNLVRVRENSEQIALLHGDQAERERLLVRFGHVVGNWYALMTRQKKLTFFTASYTQAAVVFPFIMVSPAYFANLMQLGGLMQTANAFGQVQTSLSVFVTLYRSLAEWRAVIQRLAGFEQSVASARQLSHTPPVIEVTQGDKQAVAFKDLKVRLPNGVPLINTGELSVGLGEHVLVSGPSGTGKSTLFRALAGVWPFGEGRVELPKNAKVMILPQRPYFPVAPLAVAVAYPAASGDYSPDKVAELIAAVGLPALAGRIDEEAHWNRMLSLGEQQRLGIARALLHAPDYLFLDEATASLDEAAESSLYRLLRQRLPQATVVSIGHRSTLSAFHDRRLALTREGEGHLLSEATLATEAAE